jgi:hypothetical protein
MAQALQGCGMDRDQEDFAAKLTLIDREANLVLEDSPPGATRERVQHIAMLARLLRLRLDVASSVILPAQAVRNEEQRDFAARLHLACNEARAALRELAPGIVRDRVQHIATLCDQLTALLGAEVRPR